MTIRREEKKREEGEREKVKKKKKREREKKVGEMTRDETRQGNRTRLVDSEKRKKEVDLYIRLDSRRNGSTRSKIRDSLVQSIHTMNMQVIVYSQMHLI